MRQLENVPTPNIITILQKELAALDVKQRTAFRVVNPDIATSLYSGHSITINDKECIYRSYKTWMDLAQLFHCKMLTPDLIDENYVLIRYEKLNADSSFHKSMQDTEEKYGDGSIFSQIHKNEEAAFSYYYMQALNNVQISKRLRILNLGVNSGDEFEAVKQLCQDFDALELVGIDYCASAVNAAKKKFQESENVRFYQHDINELNTLDLGRFDLIISIGTLQSSNLEYNKLLMSIVQNQLKPDGAMILAWPNCRWIDGEMIYGARVKNYPFSEMGLLYKDVYFAKKYLQQKKFRVTITGKDYIFVTATSIR
jgi:2-polyprenyl-3-methyl-5-hydroxy-6-metoxy-1,4-benzoquinol methylase